MKKEKIFLKRISYLDEKDRKNSIFFYQLLNSDGLRLIRAGFLHLGLSSPWRYTIQNCLCSYCNLDNLDNIAKKKSKQSSGSARNEQTSWLQLFFHKYSQCMLRIFLHRSCLFCLAKLTTTLENTVYDTAYVFLGNALQLWKTAQHLLCFYHSTRGSKVYRLN